MSLPLSQDNIELHDLGKSSSTTLPLSNNLHTESRNYKLHPSSKHILKKLYFALIIESIISVTIYYFYDDISLINPNLAPTLLGCSSGALAQSINQFSKKKFTLNKIFKFMIWGSINGYFTVTWINLLILHVDNLIYRIIIDQLIGAPIFQLIFNILNTIWDHGEIFSKSTRQAYLKSLKYSYCYWPFFSIFSFVFVPQTMMFPSNCLANLFWNLILSKIA
ncbi:uncharacterized protein KGF55_002855 [Candida pseudojiufengensis]|uniref:uncharacterized protein n=1 Tax=Candida pseudojiufengensis TaxID=497109 RepID=UPI0022242F9F|nr:uncharacterized protein KGF55_002855 [Candida pseudojiufengensis]KAI5963063.1 hypothetical protein KGF55_002855 [Candida pseudojiufengensis]